MSRKRPLFTAEQVEEYIQELEDEVEHSRSFLARNPDHRTTRTRIMELESEIDNYRIIATDLRSHRGN